ncbi:glycoside hydrolase family 7 protein, partial [Ramaria rubella]
LGDTTFYGKGQTVNPSSTVTIVTQFLTINNTTTGTLSEICRLYVQNNKTIQNAQMSLDKKLCDSITDTLCTDKKTIFSNQLKAQGSLATIGSSVVHTTRHSASYMARLCCQHILVRQQLPHHFGYNGSWYCMRTLYHRVVGASVLYICSHCVDLQHRCHHQPR